jgi:hypothetical protein
LRHNIQTVELIRFAVSGLRPAACCIASNGYCAAKRLYFHGIRLHLFAQKQNSRLPIPSQVWFREASLHDLTAFKEYLPS